MKISDLDFSIFDFFDLFLDNFGVFGPQKSVYAHFCQKNKKIQKTKCESCFLC